MYCSSRRISDNLRFLLEAIYLYELVLKTAGNLSSLQVLKPLNSLSFLEPILEFASHLDDLTGKMREKSALSQRSVITGSAQHSSISDYA
jgi:hypothetical protein